MLKAAAAESARSGLIVRLFYSTGLRFGELLALRTSAVQLRERRIFVHQGKLDKDRYVLFDSSTAGLLERWIASRPASGNLFELGGTGVWGAVSRAARDSGVQAHYAALGEAVSPHSLRFAFATHCYERGMRLETVRRLLGHRYYSTTAIYIRDAQRDWRADYDAAHELAGARRLRSDQDEPEEGYEDAEIAAELADELPEAGSLSLPLILTRAEVRAALQAAEAVPPEGLLLRLLYATGARPRELAGLDWLSVDWEQGALRVAGREALVDPETLQRLRHWHAAGQPLLPFSEAAILQSLQRWTAPLWERYAAMQRHFPAGVLRHAMAAHCYDNGMDLYALMRQLGHANIGTTALYVRTSWSAEHQAYRTFHPLERATGSR